MNTPNLKESYNFIKSKEKQLKEIQIRFLYIFYRSKKLQIIYNHIFNILKRNSFFKEWVNISI